MHNLKKGIIQSHYSIYEAYVVLKRKVFFIPFMFFNKEYKKAFEL